MPALFPDTLCPACGGRHNLSCYDPDRHPQGTEYRYTCPTTGSGVELRPAAAPERMILAPASAVPLTWAAD